MENLSKEELQKFKEQYKRIFSTTLIDGTELIWRRLTRSEYKDIMNKNPDEIYKQERIWFREEEICKICILFPEKEKVEEIINNMAGVASVLAEEIYEKSGFKLQKKTTEL